MFCAALMLLATSAIAPAQAQMSDSDAALRLDAMEHQMRQLTGQIEQLQFRNQQLEQQLRRLQEDSDYRFQELGAKGGAARGAQPQGAQPQGARPQGPAQMSPVQQPVVPGRRSDLPGETYTGAAGAAGVASAPRGDVYDPARAPNAPGAPQPLGALPAGQPSAGIAAGEQNPSDGPLDISTQAGGLAREQSQPSQRQAPAGSDFAAVAPPAQTPRDYYDLGVGYIQRKDYAAAEAAFRDFLKRFPGDRLSPEAQYWLGESLFHRQQYRDAAEAFLVVSTKAETSAKAPDSMLRLGQSLAAMREKSAACATFAEIGRKYPRASLAVKQGVEREQKRAGC